MSNVALRMKGTTILKMSSEEFDEKTPAYSSTLPPKPPSQRNFKPPESKKEIQEMPKSITKTDLSSVGSSTPPSTSSINSDQNDPGPSEPCQPKTTLSKMTDKELTDHLTNSYPEIKDEILYLAGRPERIGIEHLRDILISQTKNMRQVAHLGESSSCRIERLVLRDQHQTYIDLF